MKENDKLALAIIVGAFIAICISLAIVFLLFLWGGHLDKGAY